MSEMSYLKVGFALIAASVGLTIGRFIHKILHILHFHCAVLDAGMKFMAAISAISAMAKVGFVARIASG